MATLSDQSGIPKLFHFSGGWAKLQRRSRAIPCGSLFETLITWAVHSHKGLIVCAWTWPIYSRNHDLELVESNWRCIFLVISAENNIALWDVLWWRWYARTKTSRKIDFWEVGTKKLRLSGNTFCLAEILYNKKSYNNSRKPILCPMQLGVLAGANHLPDCLV